MRRVVWLSVCVALGCAIAAQAPAPPDAPHGTVNGVPFGAPSRMPLQPSDFAYLGYYILQIGFGFESVTYRYVSGDFRLLGLRYSGALVEVSLAGKSFGQAITAITNTWTAPGGGVGQSHKGLWWDESQQRLWTVASDDYNATYQPTQIYTRTLNSDGTVSNLHGPVSLQNIPAKRVYGGVQPIPAWFQQQYGVGPYAVGWGGYTSLLNQSGAASLGLTAYAIPDPASVANGTTLVAPTFRALTDHALPTEWYRAGVNNPSGQPFAGDRGARATLPVNYYDGGDSRQNPSTAPIVPPLSTAYWLSPTPNGDGRWVWGDSYYGTGIWIDTPTKHGFVALGHFGMGKNWYGSSTLHFDSRAEELHIYDPTDFGAVLQGTKQPWQVQPRTMTPLALPGLGAGGTGNGSAGGIGGAVFDATTGRMYLQTSGPPFLNNTGRIYVFQVAQ